MEENKKIIGYVISNKGKVRENNEDNYLLGNCINAESQDENEAHLYQSAGHWICVGVFDGMGGEADGEVASSVAAQTFQENTMNLQILDKDKITVLIEKTFLKANKAVIEKRKNGISGTTGTVIATDGNQFRIFHRGDSRVYIERNKNLYVVSKDHTLAQLKMDIGIYRTSEEVLERENHQLTQFIGMDTGGDSLPYESSWIKWEDNDRILIGSDGLYDMCAPDTILKCLAQCSSVEKTAKLLLQHALERGGRDNVTIAVLQRV